MSHHLPLFFNYNLHALVCILDVLTLLLLLLLLMLLLILLLLSSNERNLVRRRDVNDLRRFARRLRDGVDSGETLEHQLALQLAEPLLVDVEPDLERPLAQLESIILDRRLVLRLQVI
uniref:Uncharacterized protein n=1 Tax=Anopheles coluzzii TaxID=1518534 RepID=A0A8W7P9L8_ANOCL